MPARRVLRPIAVLAASAVLCAACATSSNNKSSDTTSKTPGSSTGALSATATGVTASTIKIGIPYPDLESLAKSGLVKTDNGPYSAIAKAIVDDVNADGGINGRKLVASISKFSVLAASDQLAVCTKLTEDDKVFAVLGGFIGDNNFCVTQQHATTLVSDYGSGYNQIALSKARAPWATPNASDERAVKALVKLLDQQGQLKGKKIGIYGATTASKALIDLTKSELQTAGYATTDTAINDTPPTDAAAFNAQDKVIGTRFMNEQIDTVIVLVTVPPGANFDAIGYHPSMYSPQTSLIMPGAFTNPYDKFPVVAGLAASGSPDVGYNTPGFAKCRAAYKRETGIEVQPLSQETKLGHSTGFTAMQQVCSAVQVFVAAAKAAGPNLTAQTWQKGLESVGKIALALSPVASFGPNKPDGQDTFQLMKQDPTWKPGDTKSEFLPVGAPITFTG